MLKLWTRGWPSHISSGTTGNMSRKLPVRKKMQRKWLKAASGKGETAAWNFLLSAFQGTNSLNLRTTAVMQLTSTAGFCMTLQTTNLFFHMLKLAEMKKPGYILRKAQIQETQFTGARETCGTTRATAII